MRVLAVAATLLLSSTIVPTLAQQADRPPNTNQQPQTVPVEPQRSPQQSEQAREQERREGEETQIGRGWRAQPSAEVCPPSAPLLGGRRMRVDSCREEWFRPPPHRPGKANF
jgi:hypothetical protein